MVHGLTKHKADGQQEETADGSRPPSVCPCGSVPLRGGHRLDGNLGNQQNEASGL